MAVMRQSIIYGGINSADYGIYIGGEGTFNAPKKIVEMVSVPGRNGDIAIDQGSYENIEVSYTAIIYEPDLESFADSLRAFRNALVSQRGYQRLADTFHPEEYRMGMFIDGFELTPIMHNTAAEFEIKFNCKPQRFLMDGESAMTVSDGQSVFNPTPFESQPLLAIEGYGTIGFNGYEVEIENATMGDIPITLTHSWATDFISPALYNVGDDISIGPITLSYPIAISQFSSNPMSIISVNSVTESGITGATTSTSINNSVPYPEVNCSTKFPLLTADAGVNSEQTHTTTYSITLKFDNVNYTETVVVTTKVRCHVYNGPVTGIDVRTSAVGSTHLSKSTPSVENLNSVVLHSTISILGNPTYIDCELGEAYLINDGEYVSLNSHIDLGSDLPTLAPGNNEFSFDDSTMTDVQLTPRWWIL